MLRGNLGAGDDAGLKAIATLLGFLASGSRRGVSCLEPIAIDVDSAALGGVLLDAFAQRRVLLAHQVSVDEAARQRLLV